MSAGEIQFYESVGRFAVAFEDFCNTMSNAIRSALEVKGLIDYKMQDVILSDMSAYQLKTLLQNITGVVIEQSDVNIEICKKIFKEVTGLIEERNEIIHSNWFILEVSDENTTSLDISAERVKANARGETVRIKEIAIGELEDACKRCHDLRWKISGLMRCFIGHSQLEDLFSVDNSMLITHFDKFIAMIPDLSVTNEDR
jgi:hypothetical protein